MVGQTATCRSGAFIRRSVFVASAAYMPWTGSPFTRRVVGLAEWCSLLAFFIVQQRVDRSQSWFLAIIAVGIGVVIDAADVVVQLVHR